MNTALEDIAAERKRQTEKLNWSPEHDDEKVSNELGRAAACYAYGDLIETQTGYNLWPWANEWWNPQDHRRNLVRAGALIVAEIERLDRAKEKENTNV